MNFGPALDSFFLTILLLLALSVPLALWKLIDFAIWLFHHVHVGVS